MGQYYLVACLDKNQYINPNDMGDGLKLMEFMSGGLTMTGLAVLLADGNGQGGGDLGSKSHVVGSWRGCRVAIVGDYAKPNQYGIKTSRRRSKAEPHGPERNLRKDIRESEEAKDGRWKNVSADVLLALMDDEYVREEIVRPAAKDPFGHVLASTLDQWDRRRAAAGGQPQDAATK